MEGHLKGYVTCNNQAPCKKYPLSEKPFIKLPSNITEIPEIYHNEEKI